jgi:hypothetical protein
MPRESSPSSADLHNVTTPNAVQLPAPDSWSRSAKKGAATSQRRKEERRAERLDEIRAQVADGTLVVRQMTGAQHRAASEVARRTRERNGTRLKLSRNS